MRKTTPPLYCDSPQKSNSRPKLSLPKAVQPAVAPLNAAQIAGNARRAAQRLLDNEQKAIRSALHRRMLQTRQELMTRFPQAFKGFGAAKIPLMIGIDAAVFEATPDINRHDLINALTDYCGGASYQRALVAGADRVNLDGQVGGTVTVGHEEHAKKMLVRLEKEKRRRANQFVGGRHAAQH
jgi:sRNA-binding protein